MKNEPTRPVEGAIDDLLARLRNHRVLSYEESDLVADEIERLRECVQKVRDVLDAPWLRDDDRWWAAFDQAIHEIDETEPCES